MCKKMSEEIKKYDFVVKDGKVFYTVGSSKKETVIDTKGKLDETTMFAFIVTYKKDKNAYIEFKAKYDTCVKEKEIYTPNAKGKTTTGTDIKGLREYFVSTFDEFEYLIKKTRYMSKRDEFSNLDIDELFSDVA